MKKLIPLAFALALSACATVVPRADPAAPASWAPVDPQHLSDWTRQLASDDFQGRAPGTEGETRTIAYLSEQFRALGLEPGGEHGGWTQRVPFDPHPGAGAGELHRSPATARRSRCNRRATSM